MIKSSISLVLVCRQRWKRPSLLQVIAVIWLVFGAVGAATVHAEAGALQPVIDALAKTNPAADDPIDDFLSHLPPSLMSQFTFQHHTDSIQGASYENPRAIVFGENAKLIISFNGDQKKAGHNLVEVTHFDEATALPVYSVIPFDMSPDKSARSRPILKDGRSCVRCHGESPKWIWDPYFVWSGAYGGVLDLRGIPDSREVDGLNRLSQNLSHMSRYRHLKPENPDLYAWYRTFQPNSVLGNLLNKLNSRRIHGILERQNYRPFRYAIIAALLDDEWINSFVPLSSQMTTKPYPFWLYSTVQDARKLYSDIIERDQSRGGLVSAIHKPAYSQQVDLERRRTAKLRYIVEGVMGLSMKDWAITQTQSYVFDDGHGSLDELLKLEVEELIKEEPELKETFAFVWTTMESGAGHSVLRERQASGYDDNDVEKAFAEKRADAIKVLRQKSFAALGQIKLKRSVCDQLLSH